MLSEYKIYSAIIAYCLISIVVAELKIDRSTYEILQIVGISLLDKTPILVLCTKYAVNELFKNEDCKNTEIVICNELPFNWF